MVGPVAVQETGAVADIERSPASPRQLRHGACGQRVALVMIEKKEAAIRRREIGKPSSYRALAFGALVRIRQMCLQPFEQAWRTHHDFPAAHPYLVNGQREKDVRVRQHIVIKEIARAGAEIIGVQCPASYRYRDSEVMLLVAFAFER